MKKNLVNIQKLSSKDFNTIDIIKTLVIRNFKDGGSVFIDINNTIIDKLQLSPTLLKKTLILNPFNNETITFNPLEGNTNLITQRFIRIFEKLSSNTNKENIMLQELLLTNCIKLTKVLNGEKANIYDLIELLRNYDNSRNKVIEMSRLVSKNERENKDLYMWFLNEFLNESGPKYNDYNRIRTQVINTLSNENLIKMLAPMEVKESVDIGRHLSKGGNLIVNLNQEFLGNKVCNFLYLLLINWLNISLCKQKRILNKVNICINNADRIIANEGIADMTLGKNFSKNDVLVENIQIELPYNSQYINEKTKESFDKYDDGNDENEFGCRVVKNKNL